MRCSGVQIYRRVGSAAIGAQVAGTHVARTGAIRATLIGAIAGGARHAGSSDSVWFWGGAISRRCGGGRGEQPLVGSFIPLVKEARSSSDNSFIKLMCASKAYTARIVSDQN